MTGEAAGPKRSSARERKQEAVRQLASTFAAGGWKVEPSEGREIDLRVWGQEQRYAVEVKTSAEGRSDRLIPLWAQACLEAMRNAEGARPLVVIAAPRISPTAAEQILEFAGRYAPWADAGIMDFEGLRRFRGEGLEALDAEPFSTQGGALRPRSDLFSDLNQWLLKVLLAPELPPRLLAAPRGRYRNPSELARAARVSVSVAYRFTRQLAQEGYLDSSARSLTLVRREHLFERWRGWAARPARDLPLRFILGGDARQEAARIGSGGAACLALFAAADALKLGFVHGVPPYLYVSRAYLETGGDRVSTIPAEQNERPDLILREAVAAQSIFRGMVERDGVPVSDILQLWLDVSHHPSRGREQAELIRHTILQPLFQGSA